MSAKRVRSMLAPAGVARAARLSLGAAAAAFASLASGGASAQEFAYCDMAVPQQSSKVQLNVNATVVKTGERRKQGLRLTEEKIGQRGTIFHQIPITFGPGTSLYSHFRVRISGAALNAPPGGGEGMSFILQNDPDGDPLMVGALGAGFTAFGAGGDGFGYKGITQSLALELDTVQDATSGDPDGNHLSLDIGGYVNHTSDGTSGGQALMGMPEGSSVAPWQPISLAAANSLESSSTSYDTRDVWFDYECAGANSCSLKVYMTFNNAAMFAQFADSTKPATLPMKPATPIMTIAGLQDISSYLSGAVGYAGFSASTGTLMDEHLVTYWIVSTTALLDTNVNGLEDTCECGSIPACNGSVPICDLSTSQGFCRDCLNDMECATNVPAKPFCNLIANGGTGACVECNVDKDCPADKKFCNAPIHTCTAGCSDDSMCDATQWCDNPSGAPYGGTCTADFANGDSMPTSANHTPALNGTCTAEAAQVVCVTGACDATDNKCGLTLGQPCMNANAAACRSNVCTGEGTCGCENDAECKGVDAGKVCNDLTRLCITGCRGTADGTNPCATDFECLSQMGAAIMPGEIGECKPVAKPGPNQVEGGYVEGAGFLTCGLASGRTSETEPTALFFLAASASMLARRRRRAN